MKQNCMDQSLIATGRFSKTCNVRNSIYNTELESMNAFAKACQNLLSLEHWNKVSGANGIVFSALDRNGEESGYLMTGFLLRISHFLDMDGRVQRDRWAVVSGVGYQENEQEECVKLVLRFIPDPLVCFTTVLPSMTTETRSFLVNRFGNRVVTRQVITRSGREKHNRFSKSRSWQTLLEGIVE